MKLGLIFVSLGLFILLLTIFSDGRQLLKFFLYKGRSTAKVAEIRPFTINDSRNAVEKFQNDGTWQRLGQTEDRAVQLRPYGFLLFDEKKPMVRFEWQAGEARYRANYRYLHRHASWQVGDTVELHYSEKKPWQYAVEDPRLPGLIVRNAAVSVLIFAIGIAAMTFVQDNMSRKDDAPNRDHAPTRMREAQPAWEGPELSLITAEHGSDYEIIWEDPGMEAHIRYLLNKENEPVMHSDVWNVQVLILWTSMKIDKGFDSTDVMLTDPRDDEANGIRRPYAGKQFPNVVSFRDLRHFDSLQRLECNLSRTNPVFADISGLEGCRYLRDVKINYVNPKSLAPLAGLPALERLSISCSECSGLDLSPLKELPALRCLILQNCGETDLSPLAELPALQQLAYSGSGKLELLPLAKAESLEQLSLSAGSFSTLEPLAQLPKLRQLIMRADSLPDLEPLPRTNVEWLDLSLDFMTQNRYKEGNYEPLSRMKNLISLNLQYHKALDFESCLAIVEGNPGLKYLDISYTPAAKRSGDLPDENILVLVDILK